MLRRFSFIIMAAVLLSATTALADEQETVNPVPVLTTDEATLIDATEIATQYNQPLELVLDQVRLQRETTEFVESLSRETLASLAGVEFDSPDRLSGRVFFRGDVPSEAHERLADLGMRHLELVGGLQWSEADISVRREAIAGALVAMGLGEAVVKSDIRSQNFSIEVALGSDADSPTGKELIDNLVSNLRDFAITADMLTVIEWPAGSNLVEPAHTYGGAWMRKDSDRWCTSGFSVTRSSDGVEGVSTAGHCEGLNKIEENDTSGAAVTVYSAPWAGEHIGSRGDIEWHTTSHVEVPEFWSNTNFRRVVKSREPNSGGHAVGTYVCHYGRSSGYSCGYIYDSYMSVTFKWNGQWVTASNMVEVDRGKSVGGDSGGPWFYSDRAFGIHHGHLTSNSHPVYSKIQNVEIQFGVVTKKG
ncbi:MAG: S1 family peptidase [Nitriliruptorales bacterium]|nr:S1 family peptidase [Nitriliruptorales bacterium]